MFKKNLLYSIRKALTLHFIKFHLQILLYLQMKYRLYFII